MYSFLNLESNKTALTTGDLENKTKITHYFFTDCSILEFLASLSWLFLHHYCHLKVQAMTPFFT